MTSLPRLPAPSAPLAAAVAVVAALVVAPRRVAVAGESMVPAFRPGDRLVVAKRIPLRPGHVVAIRDPRDGSRLLVKRVAAISGRLVEVRGDNELASTDSRTFGLLPRRTVVGTVLYRYGPPGRVGWWP